MSDLENKYNNYLNAFKGVVRWISGYTRSLFTESQFSIKAGYIHRTSVEAHDDSGFTDEFQKEVYQAVDELMKEYNLGSIIDIGCGSGFKLIKYLGNYETLGVDSSPVIKQAAAHYPDHVWMNVSAFNPILHQADAVICADVIEHVESPDLLLESISSIRNWKYLLISTPERNLKRGWYHYGPPPNPCHYREWNFSEFQDFISGYFHIINHSIPNKDQATQLIICKPR